MILVYKYNYALNILKLFAENKIVTLKIYLDDSLGEDKTYVFDYTSIDDYPEDEAVAIKKMFNSKTIQVLIQGLQVLNEFVTMKEIDNVNLFTFNFDIRNTNTDVILSYHRAYKVPSKDVIDVDEKDEYQQLISRFETLLTKKGIHDVKINDLYIKTTGSKQQRAKYNPITFSELISKMKDVMIVE